MGVKGNQTCNSSVFLGSVSRLHTPTLTQSPACLVLGLLPAACTPSHSPTALTTHSLAGCGWVALPSPLLFTLSASLLPKLSHHWLPAERGGIQYAAYVRATFLRTCTYVRTLLVYGLRKRTDDSPLAFACALASLLPDKPLASNRAG